MSALAPTVDELAVSNLAKLPRSCYVVIDGNPPGARIGVIEAGKAGASVSPLDDLTEPLDQVRHFVNKLNHRMGITPQQAQAMAAGASQGWHVSQADPDAYALH